MMARLARVLSPDTPYHVTQRENARGVVFESDSDRMVYLDLLQRHCSLHRLSLAGYCLMPNHVHIIAIPRRAESLPVAMKHVHGSYAAYFNARRAASGHVWQGRYYSCPLDEAHFWAALRYAELNPVRAGLVENALEYAWSTAAAHCECVTAPAWLDTTDFAARWDAAAWREFLSETRPAAELEAIRTSTHTGRPLGSPEFVERLERVLRRRLALQRGGRPQKETAEERQDLLSFECE